ncbi:hypothetical protein ACB478_000535 [Klebsiella quasipneumoniae]|nr:hypothetical protein [Klebsiella quasipneumoniae subsp. similipneumoniae]HBZ7526166.1 hypothetical protein [Klebsiella quasipneumoniae subsp. similipneumoniae]HBZ8085409.1 hypothetical protein [Klebsiella quasipneumoniae subsp. similipneumoniae]HCM8113058.1 hypothetical protein [Klebsiella quasipneumoniae]HDH2320835.1 hypothetical protein [Klebsiella quasipneumoniae subsp. similipneumoniae]
MFSLVSQENQNTESIFTLLDMDKFLMLALAILVMAACKPFVDASSCDETQGAINDANFFILTSLPPLNGEVQSVQIVGSQNNEYGALRFARCRQLASYERAKTLNTAHGATIVRDNVRWRNDKGWMREYIRQTRSATGNISKMVMREQFYTDSLGRIVRAENVSATQQPPKVLHTTTYQYDDRNRLVRKTVNGGMMVMLAVDYRYTDGRLSRMADSDSTSTLRWDEKGRWISRETTSTYSGARQARCLGWDHQGNCTAEYGEQPAAGAMKDQSLHYQYTYYPR